MSSFSDHIKQGKDNLEFLENVNREFSKVYDWQVTISFYTALHFVNAHVKKTMGVYHTTHKDLSNIINPNCRVTNPAQMDEDSFVAYEALFVLSRRSRYLYNQKGQSESSFTYSKHLAKAIRHLNKVMKFIDDKHSIGFDTTKISCVGLVKGELKYFEVL